MQPRIENCENCGRAIGRLEQPYVWHKHVVCAACHLTLSSAPATMARAAGDPRARHPEYRRPAGDAAPLPVAPPPPPVVPHHGPAADPFAVKPDAPTAGPPMFMCSECGHSFNFDDISSDNGRLVCRACALRVAAQRRARPPRDVSGGPPVMKFALVGLGIAAVAALVFGVYVFLDAAFTHQKLATADKTETVETTAVAPAPQPTPQPIAQAAPAPPPAEAVSGELFPNIPAHGNTTPPSAPAPEPQAPAQEPVTETPPAQAPEADAPEVTPEVAPEVPEPGPSPRTPQNASTPAAAVTAPPKPADPPPAPVPPKGTPLWHVHRGRELLTAGKARASLEEFAEAVRMDSKCAAAFHGIGLAYAVMGDAKLSIERLEKAVSLYDPPSRAAVFNLAAAHLKNNPMRAAKLAKDYLSRPDSPNDEQMHNLMGAALWRVDAQGRQNRAFAEAENFYFAYNARLEAVRTDERKRWGSKWVSASEATRKWTDYKGKRQNVERLRFQHGRAAKAAKDAHNKVYEYASDLKLHNDMEKRRVRQNYEMAVKRVDEVRQQLYKAEQDFAYAEKPPLPLTVPFVPMDPVASSASPTASATGRRTTGS